MAQTNSLRDAYDFLVRNRKLTEDVKVTSITVLGFNDMVGSQLQINVKCITVEGYKNKLIKVFTNDTYTEDFGDEETGDYSYKTIGNNIQEWLTNAVAFG